MPYLGREGGANEGDAEVLLGAGHGRNRWVQQIDLRLDHNAGAESQLGAQAGDAEGDNRGDQEGYRA